MAGFTATTTSYSDLLTGLQGAFATAATAAGLTAGTDVALVANADGNGFRINALRADVDITIANHSTLGNTSGMSYKELGQRTLITKGTLTGVIERLEQKGLVLRERSGNDKRSFFVRLTPAGDAVFAEVFPKVTAQGAALFAS